SLAWHVRGHEFASKTSQDQFQRMSDYFHSAERNAIVALSKNSKLLPAYWLLINGYNADSQEQKCKEIFEKATTIYPSSLILRAAYMNGLLPRWSGSHLKMRQFAHDSETYVEQNSNLQILWGFVDMDKASGFSRDKHFKESVDSYSAALSY